MGLNRLIVKAMEDVGVYWYIAPFYSQAKKIVWQDPEMLPKYLPHIIWDKRNNSELFVTMPNGSLIYVLGADHPDSLRGPNPRGVVLDEYGDMKPEIWSAIIQPIMAANPKAWCWFMGTPKGKNDFWAKLQLAKDNPQTWFSSILKASESGIISKEALEEAKRTTTQQFYNQEYECDFLDNASSVFRRVRLCLWSGELEPLSSRSYKLGVDVAKYNDWTVITPIDRASLKAGKQDRFNHVDWAVQIPRIEAASYRFNSATVTLDSTGVGDPLCEQLQAHGIPLDPPEGFKFTEVSRKQLLEHLAILFEQDKIRIPNDEGLIDELESFRYFMSEPGLMTERPKIRMGVPDGMTDDRVMSLALAAWGLNEPISENITESFGLYERSFT